MYLKENFILLTVTANNPSHFDFGFEHVQIISHVEITLCEIVFMSNYPDSISTLGAVRKLRKHLGVLSWSAKCLFY